VSALALPGRWPQGRLCEPRLVALAGLRAANAACMASAAHGCMAIRDSSASSGAEQYSIRLVTPLGSGERVLDLAARCASSGAPGRGFWSVNTPPLTMREWNH